MNRAGAARLLAAEGVTVRRGDRLVLDGVGLDVSAGEIVTIVGPNGAGKTTLVRVLLGLEPVGGGLIHRAPGLRVGYVPQRFHPESLLPLTVRRLLTLSQKADEAAVLRALGDVGAERLAGAQVQALSGGEVQRVLLARALLRQPDLLILDEPAQGVDFRGQLDLYDLIAALRDRHGLGVLMISHDLHVVMAATDRVVCLHHHVCCVGHPQMVAQDPAYLRLFGREAIGHVALYTHDHHHTHDPDGRVRAAGVPCGHDHQPHHHDAPHGHGGDGVAAVEDEGCGLPSHDAHYPPPSPPPSSSAVPAQGEATDAR